MNINSFKVLKGWCTRIPKKGGMLFCQQNWDRTLTFPYMSEKNLPMNNVEVDILLGIFVALPDLNLSPPVTTPNQGTKNTWNNISGIFCATMCYLPAATRSNFRNMELVPCYGDGLGTMDQRVRLDVVSMFLIQTCCQCCCHYVYKRLSTCERLSMQKKTSKIVALKELKKTKESISTASLMLN